MTKKTRLRKAWIDANPAQSDSSKFTRTARVDPKATLKSLDDRRVA